MARTTNSDTLPFVDSRYELGMLAAQRVRDLNGGAEPIVPAKRDKPTVQALREIATGELDVNLLRHELVQSHKDTPVIAEDAIESTAEDPVLKEIDAELEGALVENADVSTEEAELDSEDEVDALEDAIVDVALDGVK